MVTTVQQIMLADAGEDTRRVIVSDFCLGATTQQNIVHATDNSSRSIFVLSHQTAENDWINFAFHVTFDSYLQLCDYRVSLVSREEMVVRKFTGEVQQVVQTLSLLWEADPWFRQRLMTFAFLDHLQL
ncbi:hypothetical protein ACOMHN_067148 [Nucella lapillus]